MFKDHDPTMSTWESVVPIEKCIPSYNSRSKENKCRESYRHRTRREKLSEIHVAALEGDVEGWHS